VSGSERLACTACYVRLLLAAGDAQRAQDACQTALAGVSADEDSRIKVVLYCLKAKSAAAAGDAASACEAHQQAVAMAQASADPDSAEAGAAYHNLAGFIMNYRLADRYEEGLGLIERALRISTASGRSQSAEHAVGQAQQAVLRGRLGDIDGARAAFDASFRTFADGAHEDPNDVAAWREYEAEVLLDAGLVAEALTALRHARSLRESLSEVTAATLADADAWLGVAHFEQGDFAASSAHFRCALELRLRDTQLEVPRR
jgi:tetratricopeptide (TPR) repeat protein